MPVSQKHSTHSYDSIKTGARRKIAFRKSELLIVPNRSYGLKKVSSGRIRTLYAKSALPSSSESKENSISLRSGSASDSEQAININTHHGHLIIPDSTADERGTPMRRGTPHPMKGRPVNVKVLIQQLSESQLRVFTPRVNKPSYSIRTHIDNYSAIGSPNPTKDTVPKPKHMAKRPIAVNEVPPRKKVVFVCPPAKSNFLPDDTTSSDTSLLLGEKAALKTPPLTFEERRRLFHIGEYTIAKNGKKLSEMAMARPTRVTDDDISWHSIDGEAQVALEKYIKKQGLIRSQNNTLTAMSIQRRSFSHYDANQRSKPTHCNAPILSSAQAHKQFVHFPQTSKVPPIQTNILQSVPSDSKRNIVFAK